MEDIFKMLDETISAGGYGSATLTTQGIGGSRFTKTGRPPGIWEESEDLPISAERILKVFRMVAGSKDPVQTPEFWANVFQNRYGIEFPRNIKNINKEQAIALNKFGNDMKKTNETTFVGKKQDTFLKAKDTDSYKQSDSITKQTIQQKLKDGESVELNEEGPGRAAFLTVNELWTEADASMQHWIQTYIGEEHSAKALEDYEKGYMNFETNTLSLFNNYSMNNNYIEDMLESYMDSRKNTNLMEVMDKHRKRSTLMEGAMKRIFKAFDGGATDEELVHEYAREGITVPEPFVSKARKQWESLKKAKLDLELSEKEAKGFRPIQTTSPTDVAGMEPEMEPKQMASGLFN
tara:strand:+ start:1507 stop:2553 length:1047 start_codon:yes stop_codon:yes gene_type:complete